MEEFGPPKGPLQRCQRLIPIQESSIRLLSQATETGRGRLLKAKLS